MNLLQMSLSGAVFIIAVALIRAAAVNRLPKMTFLALWYIALIRLLLPVTFHFPFNVYSMVSRRVPALDTIGDGITNGVANFTAGTAPAQPADVENAALALPDSMPSVPVILIIWAVGAAVMAGIFTVRYLRCRQEFQTALPVRNEFTALWLKEHSLWRIMDIRQLTGLSTPLAYGIFHPVILTPKDMDWEDKRQARFILFHEYVHIRRFDAVGKLMASTALCIHWFNPFVWVLYLLFNRDIELSCDESVIRHFGERNRKDYAMALIRMEERRIRPAPFGSYFSKNATEERIKAIMKSKKKSIFALISAVVVVALGALAVFSMASKTTGTNHAGLGKVLRGEAPFYYVSEGIVEPKTIDEVPALFDPYDEYMKIWDYAVQDLDGDGEEEVILIVYGVAGDAGGKLIFHQIGGEIYGYIMDYRSLESLKADGTFGYSYLSGAEEGICTIADFTKTGMDLEKLTYASGAHWEWDTFIAGRQPATEEEYLEAGRRQDEKPDAVWYEFTDENIAAMF